MLRDELRDKHIKRLQWALYISRKKLVGLRPGDWRNIQDELLDFIYPGIHKVAERIPAVTFEWLLKMIDEKVINEIQRRFREYFKALSMESKDATGKTYEDGATGIIPPIPTVVLDAVGACVVISHPRAMVIFSTDPDEPFRVEGIPLKGMDIVAESSDAFARSLFGSQITRSQIRPCGHCRNLFIHPRKLRMDAEHHYCSTEHARAAASKAFRQRLGEKEKSKERKRGKQRYSKKAENTQHLRNTPIAKRKHFG
jgi:hypothetical protein